MQLCCQLAGSSERANHAGVRTNLDMLAWKLWLILLDMVKPCANKQKTTNVQSVQGKTASLSDLLFSKKPDILAITGIWLRSCDTAAWIADIPPSGYTFHHRPCSVGRKGGVGILLSEHFKVNSRLIPDCSTFDSICVEISDSSFCIDLQDSQPTPLNFRICSKIWQLYILNLTFW